MSLTEMMSQAPVSNSGCYGLYGAAGAESPSIDAVLDYLALFGGMVHLEAASPAFVAIDSWRVVQEAIAKARGESKQI